MRELITTEDGSNSIYVPELNENYHSTHGAIQESTHVFIENGLKEILKSKSVINIFEMGFGTGLNAFLTLIYSLDNEVNIKYSAVEAFPLESEILTSLNYSELIQDGTFYDYFKNMHSTKWDQWSILSDRFQLKKYLSYLENFQPENKFDLVYFDAFAPNVQPELWTTEVFVNIFNSMNPGSILVTYCCKGDVKRSLKSAGFSIEKLPGPPGKREILRARKV